MGCSSQYKDATPLFMEQIDVIKRLVAKYSQDMAFVTDAQGTVFALFIAPGCRLQAAF